MSTSKKINILSLSMFIYVIVFQLIILPKFLCISDFLSAAFIVLIAALAYLFFGFRTKKFDYTTKEIVIKTVSLTLIYFIVSYGLGIFTGFNKNAYSLTIPFIIRNTICPLIIIIAMELYRYMVVNSTNNKRLLIFAVVALIIFESFINVRVSSFDSFLLLFRFLTTSFIPICVKNVVLTLICRHGGYIPCLIYRIPIELYIFLIPIIPDFSYYLVSMIGVCFPILLYMLVYGDILEKEDPEGNVVDSRMLKPRNYTLDVVCVVIVIIVVTLVSGFFPYTLIAVGSDSMAPYVRAGDAVIYRKVNDNTELKINDIVVYHNSSIKRDVIHRLVKIDEDDGTYIFTTKGDSNDASDNIKVKYKDIKGVVKTRIRYIGYPTMLFKRFLKSEV